MSNKTYSDWFRIDLHIHTDKSKETKEGDYKGIFSIETLKQRLVENNVELFSLTDHNVVNVEAYEQYYSNYNTEQDPLLLLGIELDIEGTNTTYHSLLIFNRHDIEFVKAISKRLEDKYNEKKQDLKARSLSFDDVVLLFKDDDFFFIPHAGTAHKNIVKGNKDSILDTERMLILMQSALEKVTTDEIKEHYEKGFNRLLDETFQSRKDIAYINFSDNHYCDKYPCTHMGEKQHGFYYIKGTKSYESIRLAFIDPESRIKSQEDFDKINRIDTRLEKILIPKGSLLDSTELSFSPHFNAIIGGRSSGKSLLLWLLGSKIDGVSNLQTKKYAVTTSVGNEIIYIQQGEITNYFEENKLSELARKIGKKEEYDQITKDLSAKQQELEQIIGDLYGAYKKAFDDYTQQRLFCLHESDINNILSDKYIFVYTPLDKQEKINYGQDKEKINKTIENLKDILSKTYLCFRKDDENSIYATIEILRTKLAYIEERIKLEGKKRIFIERVQEQITTTNQSIDWGSNQKAHSQTIVEELKQHIRERFQNMKNLKKYSDVVEVTSYKVYREIALFDEIALVQEVKEDQRVIECILEGFNNTDRQSTLYTNLVRLIFGDSNMSIKNFKGNAPGNFCKKMNTQMGNVYEKMKTPIDYLKYPDGTTSNGKSPGYNSEQYLKIILKSSKARTIFIDQPEDNLGSAFISNELVPMIRKLKVQKQFFFVTHNPSIVVYGDAECIILAENKENKIVYHQLVLENKEHQEKICDTLDGGQYIFYNRFNKYDIHRLNQKEENK